MQNTRHSCEFAAKSLQVETPAPTRTEVIVFRTPGRPECPIYQGYAFELADLKRRAQASPNLSENYYAIIVEFRRVAYRHAKKCPVCLSVDGSAA